MKSTSWCINTYRNLVRSLISQQIGFEHSAFTLRNESGLSNFKINQYKIPPGILLTYLEKALTLIQIETHFKDNGELMECKEPFTLLSPHVCSYRKPEAESMVETKESKPYNIEKFQYEHYEREISIETSRNKHLYPNILKFLTTSSENHSDEILGISWNVSKNLIVSYGHAGLAEIWRIEDKMLESHMEVPLPHLTEDSKNGLTDIVSASWNKYGILATGGGDGLERIWDGNGELLQCLKGHEGGVIYSTKWSPNSDYLLTMGSDHLAIVWDATSSRICHKYSFKHSYTSVVEGDWKNNQEFVTCAGNEIVLWSQEKCCQIGCFNEHQQEITNIKWDPNAVLLYSICEGGIAKIWTPSQKKSIFTFDKANACNWYLNANGLLQFVYCSDKTIKFINLNDGKPVRILSLQSHEQPITMSFSFDCQVMALGYKDKLEVWSMKINEIMHTFTQCGYVGSLEWSSNSQHLAVCCNRQGLVIDMNKIRQSHEKLI